MTKMSYSDQLKHPNWQRKRLEVLNRADFKCERCHDAEAMLHVHHKRYVKGRRAWDYGADELIALCENCHAVAHDEKADFETLMAGFDGDGPNDVAPVMALVAGWAHEYRDTGEHGFALARLSTAAATIGLIAHQLFELFEGQDGHVLLIFFARLLKDDETFASDLGLMLSDRASARYDTGPKKAED